MARKRTKQELDYELKAKKIDRWSALGEQFIKWGFLALIVYFITASINTLAGQVTFAEIGIKLLGDVRVSEAAAWLLGAGGVTYGARQRKLRRDAIEVLAPRVKETELAADPKRSSSKLSPRGTTSPEDLKR